MKSKSINYIYSVYLHITFIQYSKFLKNTTLLNEKSQVF